MCINLFLDDERDPPGDGRQWLVVRTSTEAMDAVRDQGIPWFMSLDHDLGDDDTAMRFLHAFANYVLDTGADLDKLGFYVHSQNPVGRANIESFLESLMAAVSLSEG